MLILPFHPETASATIVIDGVTYRVPIVDSDGHLQVDVLSNALPTGAATVARQNTMITALQKIDDLQRALDTIQLDRLNVNVYRDGASEVKSINKVTVDASTVRVDLLTPTSGKKVRVIAVIIANISVTGANMEMYFGTGGNFTTVPSKIITFARLDTDINPTFDLSFPDGGGPVGAVDEVVSMRTGTNIQANGVFTIHYREE